MEVRRATEHLEIKNHWSYTSTPPRTYAACTRKNLLWIFDVLLTVHLSIFISVINQLDTQNFCFTTILCIKLVNYWDKSVFTSPTEQRLWCKQLIDINSIIPRRHACFMGNTIYNKRLWRHKWEFSSTVHNIHCIWYRSASFWLLLQYHGSLSDDALGKSGSVASNRWWWQMNSKCVLE